MSDSPDIRIQRILARHQVDPSARLGGGMEADVYACDEDNVLKIYRSARGDAELHQLKAFYEQLQSARLPFAVPSILHINHMQGYMVSIERRLHGQPMSEIVFSNPDTKSLDALMRTYLDTAVALSQVHAPVAFERYKLFDPLRLSDRGAGDWNHFLARYVWHKAKSAARLFERDVVDFKSKLARLLTSLSAYYSGDHRIIHGDFCPGNVLLDPQGNASAVLDFGMMTMFGDPLYEQATAWAFFDMYNALGADARNLYLKLLLERLGAESLSAMHRYLVVYSIVGADAYSSNGADDHYRWCVDNLNRDEYWADWRSP